MMAVKIVVVDSTQLPPGAEFPPLEAIKYGWEEYPSLTAEEFLDRCWRAEIIVLLSSHINVGRAMMEKMPRLQLVITVGDAAAQLDQAAARDQGVEPLAFPDALGSDVAAAQDLCNRISQAIDHYLCSIDGQGGLP
jgi:lactate dehydrogenase-like 2-hydroxyacid dehydrogenase